jgi:hypothetical protein
MRFRRDPHGRTRHSLDGDFLRSGAPGDAILSRTALDRRRPDVRGVRGDGMTQESRKPGGPDGQAVLLVAGLADLAVSTAGSALGALRGLLRRSDAGELAAEAEQDLMARGRLVLDRYATPPPAHLEILAREAMDRRAADGV